MGKIEKIFESLRLLDRFDDFYTLIFDVLHDRFDVDGNNFFIHTGGDNELHFYFIAYLPKMPVRGRPETSHYREAFLFPAQDVFGLLDIDYSGVTGWRPENLHEVASLVHDNSAALIRAFSMENNDKTILALKAMNTEDPAAIKRIRDRVRGIAG